MSLAILIGWLTQAAVVHPIGKLKHSIINELWLLNTETWLEYVETVKCRVENNYFIL